ncbi:MAG TPA: hypothetical protein VK699_13170 [Terriglobales bacterium]|nr:hypothetical protein [Terriglobales bacterium]
MPWKVAFVFVFLAILPAILAGSLRGHSRRPSPAEVYLQVAPGRPFDEVPAQCTFNVPRQWGEFVGASSSGLYFRDDSGTVRYIAQLPCGQETVPSVQLEIRRR